MAISKLPLINIITRMSRRVGFENCRKTIDNQTYKLINHIVTVENTENEEFVKNITNESNTSICKVTPVAYMPEMWKSLWYHQYNKIGDLKKWNYKLWDKAEPTTQFASWDGARMRLNHFPYNVYMIKAERFVKDGWIIYVDDDDSLYNEHSLEILVNNIIKFDEDTIHWMRTYNDNGKITEEYVMGHLSNDFPPALNLICSSNFCFHSKWLPYTAWETWRGDDYRTASSLAEVISKNNSIMEVIVDKRRKK